MDWVGGLITFAVGFICILSAIFNWDWFYESRKARTFVNIF
ncbi:MAG TPA: Imm17 family immunity protein [Acetivibrio sp.]|jgi:hypothetical protein|nr:hypothetical protein [Clostridium sp.]HQA57478.1 Imm17 family immunity protein [Acetivibrio sp.]